MKMYGKDREKGIIFRFFGFKHKNKTQNIFNFMSLNREVISYSLSVGLIVFMYLWWVINSKTSACLLLFWDLFAFIEKEVYFNIKTLSIMCYNNDFD